MKGRPLALATAVGRLLFVPAFVVAQAPKVPRVGIIFAGSSDDQFMPLRRQALRSAGYQLTFAQLDKVLKGAKPSELPAIQPSEFKLAVNRSDCSSLTGFGCERTR